jgi:ATP-dependent Clp protease ATP-binding subunit ClpC
LFAPYEACPDGSPEIHPEHRLLGLLRENQALHRRLPKTNLLAIRQRVGEHSPQRPKTSTAIDLALSEGPKRVLKYAAEEAERMAHRQIGTKHLFLGLLDEEGGFAAHLIN